MNRIVVIAVCLLVFGSTQLSAALRSRDVGLGIVLGEPSGVLGQFFMTNTSLLDVTLAWSFDDDVDLLIAVDYQMYGNIADAPREWSWYWGAGGYVGFPEDDDGIAGVRIPLGVAYSFPRSIVDVWLELAPGLQLVPDTEAALMGGLGVTFWIR